MIPGIATAGIGLIGGGIEAIIANRQRKKLQKQLDAQVRPEYKTSPYETDILNLAESQAGKGMSDAARAAYMNDADAGLSGTISAIQKGGGDVNTLGNAYGKYTAGLGEIAKYDDQARIRNTANVMSAWARGSANDDKKWQTNVFAPYADKRAALTEQLKGATNMFQSGLNTAFGGLAGGLGQIGQSNAINNAGVQSSGATANTIGSTGMTTPAGGGEASYGNTPGTGDTYETNYNPYAYQSQGVPDFSSNFGGVPFQSGAMGGFTPDNPIGGATKVPTTWGWSF